MYENILTASIAAGENLVGWTLNKCSLSNDTAEQFEGGACYKLTLTKDGTVSAYVNIFSLLDVSKYYAVCGHVKKGNLSGTGARLNLGIVNGVGTLTTDRTLSTKYSRVGFLIQPSDLNVATSCRLTLDSNGLNGQYAFYDALSVQEITATEYTQGLTNYFSKYPFNIGLKNANFSKTLVT